MADIFRRPSCPNNFAKSGSLSVRFARSALIAVCAVVGCWGHAAFATTDIYYSVGQNTLDHKTGSPTMDLSGGIATFSIDQTATTTGIGDVVTYNTNQVAYISGKISQTQWTLQTATGTAPADVTGATVNSIAHAFSSLATALLNSTSTSFLNSSDLVANDWTLNFPCYYDSGPDGMSGINGAVIQGWTTGPNNGVRIYTPTSTTSEVNLTQRAAGKWDTTKYYIQANTDRAIFIGGNAGDTGANYVWIDGLQFQQVSTNMGHLIDIYRIDPSNKIQISNSIFQGTMGATTIEYGILSNSSNTNLYLWNNIFFNYHQAQGRPIVLGGNSTYGAATAYISNNTIWGGYYSVYASTTNSANFVLKNNISQGISATSRDYNCWLNTGYCSFSASSTNNVSYRAVAPGSNPINNATVSFVSTSTGDLHLVATSTNMIRAGANLSSDTSLPFNVDIDNQTRKSGDWDIGADEFYTTIPAVISSVASSTTPSTATITWTTDELSTSTVDFGLTEAYGNTSSSDSYVTAHSVVLTDLAVDTVYHFRVSSQDTSGNATTSTDYTFKTTAAVNIYYSVGQNTLDHKTGSPTMDLSGGIATFSIDQTATTTGIGDVVTYNTNQVAYISGKISQTQWTLQTATGTAPADVTGATVNSIAHAFSSLATAVLNATSTAFLGSKNLVANNWILNFPCYFDSGPDIITSSNGANIYGLTTGPNNYVRIYTPTSTVSEVNQTQRTSGKWDDNKFNLREDGMRGIFIGGNGGGADYVRIDGLQMSQTYSTTTKMFIDIYQINPGNDIRISNTIFQGSTSTTALARGIYANDDDTNLSAWNNIFYNMPMTNGYSFQIGGTGSGGAANAYIYNNTIWGGRYGMYTTSTGNVIIKNNIVQGATYQYSRQSPNTPYSTSSTNNASNGGSTPGLNPLNNATVLFVSTSTGDLHLVSSSSNVIDAGADLSGDTYLPFATDIDSQSRFGTWDMGADEYIATGPVISGVTSSTTASTATISWTTDASSSSTVQYGLTTAYGSTSSSDALVTSHSIVLTGLDANTAYHFRVESQDSLGVVVTSTDYVFSTKSGTATDIYYSVGQNTSDHKTGSPTMDLSGGIATFSIDQTATTTGIGDVVTYNTNQVAYISGKISQTQWTLQTATGTAPADVTGATVNSIAHAFSSLSAALMNATTTSFLNSMDLVTNNLTLNIPCYYDSGPDTVTTSNGAVIQGWTTGPSNYIRIYTPTSTTSEVNVTQRAAGKTDSTKYMLRSTNIRALYIGGASGATGANHVRIDGLQFQSSYTGAGLYLIDISRIDSGNDIRISNSIFVGVSSSTQNQSAIFSEGNATQNLSISNNVFYNFPEANPGYPYVIRLGGAAGDPGGVANAYIYNNTFVGGYYAVYASTTGVVVVKNNIAQSNGGSGYYARSTAAGAVFSPLSANNISTLPDNAGANAISNVTIPFVNAADGDFHLAPTSTYWLTSGSFVATSSPALRAGTNLTTDPDGFLSLPSDIDGQARPSNGVWDIGADQYFDITAPVISNVSSSTAATSTLITWLTNENSSSTLQYGLTTGYGSTVESQTMVAAHSLATGALVAGNTYHFRVLSQDMWGNVATSPDYSFYFSGDDTAPPVISSIAASTTQSTATITWTTDQHSTSYIQYGLTTSYGAVSSSAVLTNTHALSFSGLSPNTLYHFTVTSQDAAGNVATSSDGMFRTGFSSFVSADYTSIAPFSSLTNAQIQAAATLKLMLRRASVGGNISDALTTLQSGNAVYDRSNWDFQFRGNPGWQNKINDFTMNVGLQLSDNDVMAMKFCYVDTTASSTAYINEMNAMEAAYPTKTFMWWTMPTNQSSYVAINAFNQAIRTYASAHNKILFDIAAIESHESDGTPCTTSGTESMCSTWTSDGGHLNTAGGARVAQAFWVLMANVASSTDTTAPVISSVSSTSITQTSGRITWTTDINSTSTVQYGTTTDYGSASSSSILVTTHGITLTSLAPSTTYHYRVSSQDANGHFGTSSDYSFVTLAAGDATAPVISSVSSTAISQTEATITWTTDESSTSTVQYGLTTGYGSASTSASLATSHSIALSGLTASTTYHFRVGSQDAAGNATTTGDYTFTTAAASDLTVPTIAAFSVPATSNNRTVSILSFTATDNILVTGYLVNESSSTPSIGDAGWSATAQTSYTFATDGDKNLYAWAKDAANNVSASSSASVSVDTTPPVISSVASSTAATTATVTWTMDANSTSTVRYGLTTGYGSTSSSNSFSTSHSIVLTGLISGTTYHFRASSQDAFGNHASSSDFTLQTATASVPVVTAFSIPSTSNSQTISITTFTATDTLAITGYLLTESSATPTLDYAGWSVSSPASYAFLSSGTKTLYAWVKNIAGNISVARSASVTISVPTSSGGGGGGGGGGGATGYATATPAPNATTNTTSSTSTPTSTETAQPAITSTSTSPDAPLVIHPANVDVLVETMGTVRNIAVEQQVAPQIGADAKEFRLSLRTDQIEEMTNFIAYGISTSTKKLGQGERRALLRDYMNTVHRAEVAWTDIERMANGQIPLARNLPIEQTQVVSVLPLFKKMFGHMPNFKSTSENMAWNTLMYRIRFTRDLTKETMGVKRFVNTYRRSPKSPLDWSAVRVLGYVK